MTTDRRARRARESARALTPPPTSTVPQTVDALRRGARFVWGTPFADGRMWAGTLDLAGLPTDVCACVAALADDASRPTVVAAAEACERAAANDGLSHGVRERCAELGERARFLAAFLGHYPSICVAMHQADLALAASTDDAERRLLLQTRAELSYVGHLALTRVLDPQRDATRGKIRESAWEDLRAEAELVTFWEGLDAKAGPVRDTGFDPRDEDHPLANAFDEDLDEEPEAAPAGVVVFPRSLLDAGGKADGKRDIERALGRSLGVPLRRIPVPVDWAAWEAGLNAESPWLAPVNRAIRAGQGGRTHWDHDAILVVGPAGAGKSRHGGRVAAVSGLPTGRYNLDTTSDNSLGGTSIRWSSGHLGFVERLLAGAGTATALCQYDEADKCGGTRNSGGHAHDILHGLLERETARCWRSPYLLGEVDLSHCVHLLTANTTDGIPSSLLDRMTVVRVGQPGPEHLGLLAPALAREACRELGLDERWGDLDREELDALAGAWRGGSVRRLQRLVRGLLQARDAAPVARH